MPEQRIEIENKLKRFLKELTYEELLNLEKKLQTNDFKNLLNDKKLNDEMNNFIEVLDMFTITSSVYYEKITRVDEQDFNNTLKECYKLIKFDRDAPLNLLMKTFYVPYPCLDEEEIRELYDEIDVENVKPSEYFEALNKFQKTRRLYDLMAFMKKFEKAKGGVDIQRNISFVKNYHNQDYVICKLIEDSGLDEDRIELPRYDHDFSKFLIKGITRKEEEEVYKLFKKGNIKSIDEFKNLGMTLITV